MRNLRFSNGNGWKWPYQPQVIHRIHPLLDLELLTATNKDLSTNHSWPRVPRGPLERCDRLKGGCWMVKVPYVATMAIIYAIIQEGYIYRLHRIEVLFLGYVTGAGKHTITYHTWMWK